MSSRKATRASRPKRWWLWLSLAFIAFALIFPIIEVTLVRFIDPPFTPLMLLRPLEARLDGRTAAPRQYRWRPLGRVSRDFLRCVIASEDQRFFQHDGFDWREIELARRQAAKTGRQPRGASTITMQCARSTFLWQGRSWLRKGLEAYYTFWMEMLLPKRRILELYVNVIEMGDGIYGIEAAARAHFGVEADALTLEQCAALAAILPNPLERDPRTPSPAVRNRIAKILHEERNLALPADWLR